MTDTDETVSVSKSQLRLLEQTAQLTKALWDDPKHGLTIKEAAKEKFPDAIIPEVDSARALRSAREELQAEFDAKTKTLRDEIDADRKARTEEKEAAEREKAEKKFSDQVDATKRKYQLTPEGMEKVFARMKEMNNPDVEAAAAWVTDHQQQAKPTDASNYSPTEMNLYGSAHHDSQWEELNKNPLRWGGNEISKMLDDFNNGRAGNYIEFGGTL